MSFRSFVVLLLFCCSVASCFWYSVVSWFVRFSVRCLVVSWLRRSLCGCVVVYRWIAPQFEQQITNIGPAWVHNGCKMHEKSIQNDPKIDQNVILHIFGCRGRKVDTSSPIAIGSSPPLNAFWPNKRSGLPKGKTRVAKGLQKR